MFLLVEGLEFKTFDLEFQCQFDLHASKFLVKYFKEFISKEIFYLQTEDEIGLQTSDNFNSCFDHLLHTCLRQIRKLVPLTLTIKIKLAFKLQTVLKKKITVFHYTFKF